MFGVYCCAEQECHLTTAQVNDPHHLDPNPGYAIKDEGAESCGDTLKLTFEQCGEARLALDWNADAVAKTNKTSLPTGCYRQQKEEYRFQHSKSSYLWYFNEATEGQSDSKSEPVCQGKAERSCLYSCSISYWRALCVLCCELCFVQLRQILEVVWHCPDANMARATACFDWYC